MGGFYGRSTIDLVAQAQILAEQARAIGAELTKVTSAVLSAMGGAGLVGYQNPNAGSVLTTVDSKLANEYVDVTEGGATLNVNVDQSANILTAWNLLAEGQKLRIPKGGFCYLATPLSLVVTKRGTGIVCDGEFKVAAGIGTAITVDGANIYYGLDFAIKLTGGSTTDVGFAPHSCRYTNFDVFGDTFVGELFYSNGYDTIPSSNKFCSARVKGVSCGRTLVHGDATNASDSFGFYTEISDIAPTLGGVIFRNVRDVGITNYTNYIPLASGITDGITLDGCGAAHINKLTIGGSPSGYQLSVKNTIGFIAIDELYIVSDLAGGVPAYKALGVDNGGFVYIGAAYINNSLLAVDIDAGHNNTSTVTIKHLETQGNTINLKHNGTQVGGATTSPISYDTRTSFVENLTLFDVGVAFGSGNAILNNYSTGTWSAVCVGFGGVGTAVVSNAIYTIIGRKVFLECTITPTGGAISTAAGTAHITGMTQIPTHTGVANYVDNAVVQSFAPMLVATDQNIWVPTIASIASPITMNAEFTI